MLFPGPGAVIQNVWQSDTSFIPSRFSLSPTLFSTQLYSFLVMSFACSASGNRGCMRSMARCEWNARVIASHSGSNVSLGRSGFS